ncbi:hypothetical protein J25TS5_33390 [Paenibacillus faecis]|uniref:hypothetical protein n=1 Tax=Paenibacillus faecis TaxID=862114 RepID=UPI001B0F5BC5|nr:hypothetical protein [Paenibacillus faecis]GIO86407.1 hypothetical protein J25TS5_33390 [Paenibacillus faecis]
MQQLKNVELVDITLRCRPKMHNFDSWRENISHFSYEFMPGKIYAIVSQPGGGGWALSYLLSAKVSNYTGRIFINQEMAHSKDLLSYGWYIGEGVRAKNNFGLVRKLTVREQLISCELSAFTIEKLVDLFELSPSRLDRELKYISNERWNASAAIGLAHGKQIYCFPWMDDMWKEVIKVRLRHCSEVLKQNNCLVIIPTPSLQIVKDFVDEVIYLKS